MIRKATFKGLFSLFVSGALERAQSGRSRVAHKAVQLASYEIASQSDSSVGRCGKAISATAQRFRH